MCVSARTEKKIGVSSRHGVISIFSARNGEKICSIGNYFFQQYCLSFSPDGKKFASVSGSHLNVWSAVDGTLLFSVEKATIWTAFVTAFNPNGDKIVTISHHGPSLVYSSDNGELLFSVKGYGSSAEAYNVSGDKIWPNLNDSPHNILSTEIEKILFTIKEAVASVYMVSTLRDPLGPLHASLYMKDVDDPAASDCLEEANTPFPHHYGLSVFGCDFCNLHPDSRLSEEDKAILLQYGAMVD